MFVDTTTLSVLKNFSSINPSIIIERGDVIKTISPNKTMMAKAKIEQSFDKTFGLCDISNFISVLSMFENPVLDFNEGDHYVKITSDNDSRNIKYVFSEMSLIEKAPNDIKIGDIIVEFILSEKTLVELNKAVGIFKVDEVAIIGDGSNITINVIDNKRSGSEYSDVIGKTDKVFKAFFRKENLIIRPNTYKVKMSVQAAHFSHEDIEYWIAVEQHSKF
jgi:hypothetical protein